MLATHRGVLAMHRDVLTTHRGVYASRVKSDLLQACDIEHASKLLTCVTIPDFNTLQRNY